MDTSDLQEQGFMLLPHAVDADRRARLLRTVTAEDVERSIHHRSGATYAARGLLAKVPRLAAELAASGIDGIASAALACPALPIDAVYFDKHIAANWSIPGHQD